MALKDILTNTMIGYTLAISTLSFSTYCLVTILVYIIGTLKNRYAIPQNLVFLLEFSFICLFFVDTYNNLKCFI